MKTSLIALSFAAALSMLSVSSVPASAFCILGFIGNSCGSPPKGGGVVAASIQRLDHLLAPGSRSSRSAMACIG